MHHGYVSLLDFRRSLLEIGQTFLRWSSFVLPSKPVILIQLDQVFIDEQIVRHEDFDYENDRTNNGGFPVRIPYVEAWYPDKISLTYAIAFFYVDSQAETFQQIQPGDSPDFGV